MPTIKDVIDNLSEIKEAEQKSTEEKAAAKLRAKREQTKYGLRLETDNE